MPTGDELYEAFKRLKLTYADGAMLFDIHPSTVYLWVYRGPNPLPVNHASTMVAAIILLAKKPENAGALGRTLKLTIAQKGVYAARKKVLTLAGVEA